MINLQTKSNDIGMVFNNNSNKKDITKHTKKDFANVLKDEKNNYDKSKKSNICNIKDKKIKSKDKIVDEDKVMHEGKRIHEDKVIAEDDEQIEEIASKMNAILQVIFNLMAEFEEEPIKLEEVNLEILKLEIEKLDHCMEQFLEEESLSFNHEDMVKAYEAIENLASAIKEQLDQMESNKSENSKNTKMKDVSIKANEIKDKLVEIGTKIQLDDQNDKNIQSEKDLNNISNENKNLDNMSSKDEVLNFDENVVEDSTKEAENTNVFSLEGMNNETSKEVSQALDKELPIIDEKQIIDQIVNKAKLVINEEKQEIRIQLKPEILGELMLKIESEKGVLLAKIMVDNYKTKELIEANLYRFKEEIKESGLEIKTFEVFVGNNEDFQKENKQRFKFDKKSKNLNIKDKGIEEIEIYDNTIVQSSQNPYDGGRLNLFA